MGAYLIRQLVADGLADLAADAGRHPTRQIRVARGGRPYRLSATDAPTAPNGSLLTMDVEVQAAACRYRVDQGLQLWRRGRIRPCCPPALQSLGGHGFSCRG